ncbi:MAG: hydrogenase expression/formation protein HypE [Acidobacteria bacterium]|nr:hydrogenase expression/formation protein HypE [Acidobacteriota bacterium]
MSHTSLEERIALKHGAGGRAMRALIEQVLLDGIAPGSWIGADAMDDGAAIRVGEQWLVVTTDSHVVQPAFFPGGDIGRLAVCGTVNDLAMMGATEPLGLTCAMVLEEGFSRESLLAIHASMRQACAEAGTTIVTGDTKVMGRGEVDGIVVNTTGVALTPAIVRDAGLQPGDRIIVTGTIGDHGLAVTAARHKLGIEGTLQSDVAPINGLARAAIAAAAAGGITAMKDPTRGGLASALHEMAAKSRVGIVLEDRAIPISDAVRGAAELLGIDPLHVANEGKAVIGVRAGEADAVLRALRGHALGRDAAIVGTCVAERPGLLVLDTGFGRRLVAEPEGEPLPRIC